MALPATRRIPSASDTVSDFAELARKGDAGLVSVRNLTELKNIVYPVETYFANSSVVDVGGVPQSFKTLEQDVPRKEFIYGVGGLITPNGVQNSPELKKYFIELGAMPWSPVRTYQTSPDEPLRSIEDISRSLTEGHMKAIDDIVKTIVADYKTTWLYKIAKGAVHEIYGEIGRRYVNAHVGTHSQGQYDDSLLHVDFVPRDMPCVVYLFANNNPTEFHTGGYPYTGNLTSNYWSQETLWFARIGEGPRPYSMESEARRIYRSDDARTLLHQSHIAEDGYRTFGRIFIGLSD